MVMISRPRVKLDSLFDPVLQAHSDYCFNQSRMGDYAELGAVGFIKHVGTIRLGYGRRTGKTSYIGRSAQSHDIIFASSSYGQKVLQQLGTGFQDDGCLNVHVHPTLLEAQDIPMADANVGDVWIDDASTLDPMVLDRLYKSFASEYRRFILVG